jgi:Uma2 family endonuclease
MTALAQISPTLSPVSTSKVKTVKSSYVSWASFQTRFLTKEDGFTYEWNNGTVEKTLNSMTISQYFIWINLHNFFKKLISNDTIEGNLLAEADILLNTNLHRRPDIGFFTNQQIVDAMTNQNQIPLFVAEIISPTDRAEKVKLKVKEYLASGVEVVWNIYPNAREVEIYTSKGEHVICSGTQKCSAESVISGFLISVDEILKAPQV